MDKQERNITYSVLTICFKFLAGLFSWLVNSNEKGQYDPKQISDL